MAKKKYGQNFLSDEKISKKIVELEKINNKNILEIGTGNLALTKYISSDHPKTFISLEIDNDLSRQYNNSEFSKYILNDDALTFNEIKKFNRENFSIISNLPFNISSKLLTKWIYLQNKYRCIDSMTLMFQKELGERIASNENCKKYGRLSILTNAFFSVKKKLYVSKNKFKPSPKVDAIVLQFKPYNKNKIKSENLIKLEKITSFFFNERRKKNEKKFKQFFNNKIIIKKKYSRYFLLRPENLKPDIYFEMAELL